MLDKNTNACHFEKILLVIYFQNMCIVTCGFERSISVAPITQVMHVRNKNSNIQGRSLNAIKMIFHSIRNCS